MLTARIPEVRGARTQGWLLEMFQCGTCSDVSASRSEAMNGDVGRLRFAKLCACAQRRHGPRLQGLCISIVTLRDRF
jgi:hypothetical protein